MMICHAIRLTPGALRAYTILYGPESGKYVTEDCTGVGDQAPVSVNATGSRNKKFTQQAFHPGLFILKPRSPSLGKIKTPDPQNLPTLSSPVDVEMTADDNVNSVCPPPWQRIPTDRNPKRMRPSNSPPDAQTQTAIKTSNRYSGLPIDLTEESKEDPPSHVLKINKPPPIILYGIEGLSKLTELLN